MRHRRAAPFTEAYMRQRLRYLPVTGQWLKIINSRRRQVIEPVGYLDKDGYVLIPVDGTAYRAHILAHYYCTGRWPEDDIDHENRVKSDNRWVNLREATRSQNAANSSIRVTNTSGRKGVFWCKQTRRWRACITVDGKNIHLGRFDDLDAAGEAYAVAAAKHFGSYARTA